MNKISHLSSESGFTIMELMVVLIIISIMLVFTLPEFNGRIIHNDTKTTLNWIVFNVSKLKKEAENKGKNYFMCINPETNTIRIGENPSNAYAQASAKEKNVEISNKNFQATKENLRASKRNIIAEFPLPDDINIDSVIFNIPDNISEDKAYEKSVSCIGFYKKGYSDNAIIHISDNNGNKFSCLIQPFLHKVKIYEKYIDFE